MALAGRLPLTRERIITVAVGLVDTNGLEALSMRKLGAALGVEAMSLYNHVANKDEVLDGVLDAVVREIPLPDDTWDWERQIRFLAHGFRDAGQAHPGVLPLFGSRAVRTVEGFAPLECAYGILRDAGLDPAVALDAFLTLATFVLGFALLDQGGMREVAAGRTLDFGSAVVQGRPRLVEMGEAIMAGDSQREFEQGLDLIIGGLRALGAPPAP